MNMTDFHATALDNGLKIIQEDSPTDTVYCGLFVDAGTRDEDEADLGLAHFCEHTTFKGTTHRRAWHIRNGLERVGGDLNAYTNKEETVYYASVLREDFDKAADLLFDIVFHSVYPEAELQRESQVIIDEIDSYKEDMGKWYSLFVRIILPFLIFLMPANVVCARFFDMMAARYFGGIIQQGDNAAHIVFWVICMLIFLAILIFLPRFATFVEFVVGGTFIYMAMFMTFVDQAGNPKPLISSGLGYFVIIVLSVFLFMKLVFLVFEIMYMIIFRGEKEPKAYKDDDNDIVF